MGVGMGGKEYFSLYILQKCGLYIECVCLCNVDGLLGKGGGELVCNVRINLAFLFRYERT